jgi:hypothetical protein
LQNYWLSNIDYQKPIASWLKDINEMEDKSAKVAPAEREFANSLLAIVTEFGLGMFLKRKMIITKLEYVAKNAFFMNQNRFVKLLSRGLNREVIAG